MVLHCKCIHYIYVPVHIESVESPIVDFMLLITAGKSDSVTANTKNTLVAYTQICRKGRAEERMREGQKKRTEEGQWREQNRDSGDS